MLTAMAARCRHGPEDDMQVHVSDSLCRRFVPVIGKKRTFEARIAPGVILAVAVSPLACFAHVEVVTESGKESLMWRICSDYF